MFTPVGWLDCIHNYIATCGTLIRFDGASLPSLLGGRSGPRSQGMAQAHARALADFQAVPGLGQVSFKGGDRLIIDLTKPLPEGFMSVKIEATGREGIVPMSAPIAVEGPQSTLLASFEGENKGELSAAKGAVVTLLTAHEEVPNGWVLVACGDDVGFLPETYVAPVIIERPPRVVLADFVGTNEGELTVKQGDYVLLMKPDETAIGGWAKVAPIGAFELEAAAAFVPASYLLEPPRDGVFQADFTGETLGELPAAKAGDEVWKIDREGGSFKGWVDVVLRSGVRGQAPETYILWEIEPPKPVAEPGWSPTTPGHIAGAVAGEWAPAAADPPATAPAAAPASALAPAPAQDMPAKDNEDAEWVESARAQVSAAHQYPAMRALALDNYDPGDLGDLGSDLGDLGLGLRKGQELLVFDTAPAPVSWLIGESGGRRGLVPATYVELQNFMAVATTRAFDAESGLRLSSDEVVTIIVAQSTPDAWWAVPDRDSSTQADERAFEGGLIARTKLRLLSSAEAELETKRKSDVRTQRELALLDMEHHAQVARASDDH